MAVPSFPKASSGAPSTKDGVPTREPNPGGHVFHDVFEVVDATSGVDPWPAEKVPFGEVLTDPFLHVECGELS